MRRWAATAAVAVLLIVDRLTKRWALDWLAERGSVKVLPFFSLTYVENTGAAFGLGRSRNGFFIALSTLLIAALLYLMKAWSGKSLWIRVGLLLVASGALGNLYDRLAYGFVVDFLQVPHWPVFNVADSCVTIGACSMAWGLRLEDKALAGA